MLNYLDGVSFHPYRLTSTPETAANAYFTVRRLIHKYLFAFLIYLFILYFILF